VEKSRVQLIPVPVPKTSDIPVFKNHHVRLKNEAPRSVNAFDHCWRYTSTLAASARLNFISPAASVIDPKP
jgi:hypothetical protein